MKNNGILILVIGLVLIFIGFFALPYEQELGEEFTTIIMLFRWVLFVGMILLIVGIILSIVIFMKRRRYCPDCGKSISFDAKICPYCKKDFGEI